VPPSRLEPELLPELEPPLEPELPPELGLPPEPELPPELPLEPPELPVEPLELALEPRIFPPSIEASEAPLEPLELAPERLVLPLEPLEPLPPPGPGPELDPVLASDVVPLPQSGVELPLSDEAPHAGKVAIQTERNRFDRVRMADLCDPTQRKPPSGHRRTDETGVS
jgi:hypothetical protein